MIFWSPFDLLVYYFSTHVFCLFSIDYYIIFIHFTFWHLCIPIFTFFYLWSSLHCMLSFSLHFINKSPYENQARTKLSGRKLRWFTSYIKIHFLQSVVHWHAIKSTIYQICIKIVKLNKKTSIFLNLWNLSTKYNIMDSFYPFLSFC